MPCSHCQTIEPLPADAELYLAPAPHHVAEKVRAAIASVGALVEDAAPGTLRTVAPAGVRETLLDALDRALSDVESAACQALLMPRGVEPGLAQLMQMTTLAKLVARSRAGWLSELLEAERLTTHFQPIVAVREPERAFAYECLTRGLAADGALVPPQQLFDAARSAELLYHLDRAARIAAIRNAVHHGIDTPIFINFNPTSIYDATFCLQTTMRAVEQTQLDPTCIVFEVVESDEVRDTSHLLRIVQVYREAGCRVALDDFGAGYSSVEMLATLRPDFVKFDRGLLRDITRDTFRGRLLSGMVQASRDLGIATLVEGVETEEDWEWIAHNDVDYAQGYFIARPGAPPPPLAALPRYSTA